MRPTAAGDQLELLFGAAIPRALRGEPDSIRAGIAAVREHAKLLGYAAPEKHEVASAEGKPLFADFLAAIDRYRGEKD